MSHEAGADSATADTPSALPLNVSTVLCPTCGRTVEPTRPTAAETSLPTAAAVSHRQSQESIFYQDSASPVPASYGDAGEPASGTAAIAVDEAPVHGGQEVERVMGFPRAAPPARSAPRRRIPISIWLLVFFIPYSLASTIGLWMLYQQLQQERAKANRNTGPEPEPDPAPATAEPVKLGETKRVGGLEVTPVRVVWQRSLRREFPPGGEDAGIEALVLHVRIKNVSDNILRPLHPAFIRRHESALTCLAVGKARYYGPARNPAAQRFPGQRFEELKPGEEMEVLVFAAADASGKSLSAHWNDLPEQEACRWNVALLAGSAGEPFGKRSLEAVWILPVTFSKQEVAKK